MGTILSPWRYDAAARHPIGKSATPRDLALRLTGGRLPEIATWSAYPSIAAVPINPGIDVMCHNRTGLAADEQDGTSNPYPPASLIDAAVPASGKKESNAACHVRLNLRTQLLELLAEQRSQHQGEEDHILEEPRRCCQALRGERW